MYHLIKLKVSLYIYRIRIDYSTLPENLRELDESDDIKKMADKLLKSISNLTQTVDKIQAPNMRVICYVIRCFLCAKLMFIVILMIKYN